MVEIQICHSYKDNYYLIDTVTVKVDDPTEKERIEKLVKEHNLEDTLVDFVDLNLLKDIAKRLGIKVGDISCYTLEIDMI